MHQGKTDLTVPKVFSVVTTAVFRLAVAVQDPMPLMWAVQCRAVVSIAESSDTALLYTCVECFRF